MAEEFQTGICSSNWWNAMRSSTGGGGGGGSAGFDGSAVAVTAAVSSVSCSTGIDDMVSYGWTGVEIVDSKTRSCEDSSMSGSSVTFLDGHKAMVSVPMVTAGSLLIDPSLPIADWNQALLRNSTGITHQSEFIHHPMLQEELSSKPYFHQDPSTTLEPNQVQMGVVDDMNQAYMVDNHHTNSGNDSGNSFPGLLSVSNYGGSPAVYLQGLFDPQQPSSGYDNLSHSYNTALSSNETNQSPLPSWPKFPQFFKPSQPFLPQLKQQQQQQAGQLHFSNNTAFWNAPASTAVVDTRPAGFLPTMNIQFFSSQNFEPKPSSTNSTVISRSVSESGRDSIFLQKKGGNEPSFKKPRVETPSPLPTFKVRKEKLSDRVTALQQLVSPFGKTDTASVLLEAIEYIKYLHNQVNVLSSPYLKNGQPMQPQQQQNSEKSKDGTAERPKQDLHSRGLCLVPIASTFHVANEPLADIFTPTFGGSYR